MLKLNRGMRGKTLIFTMAEKEVLARLSGL